MKPIKNTFLIKADTDSETNLNITGVDGLPLMISKRFNPLHHTTQYGEIVETPFDFDAKSINSRFLRKGDKIFFHYLVCQEENKVILNGEELFFCNYDQVWAVIENDKLIPVDEVVFCKHLVDDKLESDSGLIIKEYETNVAHKLWVYSANHYSRSQGINEGDTVIVIKGAGVPIKDSDIVWIKISNIIGVNEEHSIRPLKGKNIIIEDNFPDITMWRGLMVGDMHRSKFCTGMFFRGEANIKAGSKVTYVHSMSSRFELDGIRYACIEKKDLIFINN